MLSHGSQRVAQAGSSEAGADLSSQTGSASALSASTEQKRWRGGQPKLQGAWKGASVLGLGRKQR